MNTAHPHYSYFGTACYFTYAGFPFIATAKHVLNDAPQVDHHFHGKGEDAAFPLRSGWLATEDEELDIAVMGCFQRALDEAGVIPLPYTHLLSQSFDHHDAFYYCNGHPGANETYLPFLGEYSIRGNPCIGKAAQLPDQFDSSKVFAIEYPSKVDPRGMSGAPVWNIRLHCMNALDSWSADAATFAGIAQRWCPEEQILIVTRVEHVRDFVPGAIEHLRKKYRWKDGNDTLE